MTAGAPLRILHCFRSPVGGIFRHVRDLAWHHARAGHAVGILCDSTTGGPHEDALFAEIAPHLALGITRIPIQRSIGPADFRATSQTLSLLKSCQPDILHGHGAKGGALVRLAGARLAGRQPAATRFYSPHGGSLHYDAHTLRGQAFFAIERLFERWTDTLLFVSDYERQVYSEKVGPPKVPSELIYNGLRADEFEPVTTADDAPEFLYIGMMRDLKGPDIFIAALRRAEQIVRRPLRAVMVGDGDDKPRYRKRIEMLGLGGRVEMHAAMPARAAFAMARHVVVPSRAESMPYIVLEAVAAGKTILASRVGGIPEILGQDSAALVAPGDIEALAQAMARAAEEPHWLQDALPKLDDFRCQFSRETMASRMLALYRRRRQDQPAPDGIGLASSLS
ncbi:glycosyltransferase [Pseudohoeflea coraliihabitans]|uniref:Glycosyltransferase n=1 Tax=Pseudohoeflea coraliihabitans TaxID=2860393 RepID=A0ABS6WUQ7_9HYPH|nr:glycosyltransferase [Pseudohoeflea sp. DP4N28-3]MBW3098789.1 glycosyltransferase [Pseudohoeflea sp. DP4N28-3]